MWPVALALGLFTWTGLARLVRAEFLALREREFVDAARVANASDRRIIFKHILPNTVGTIVVSVDAADGRRHPHRGGARLPRLRRPAAARSRSARSSATTRAPSRPDRGCSSGRACSSSPSCCACSSSATACATPSTRARSGSRSARTSSRRRRRDRRDIAGRAPRRHRDGRQRLSTRWRRRRAERRRTTRDQRACRRASVTGAPVALEPGVVEVTGGAQLAPTVGGSAAAAEPDGRVDAGRRAGRPAGRCAVRRRQVLAPGVAASERSAPRAPGAGALHAVNRPYAVTSVSAHFVSTSWIAGHGMSMVRVTLTSRTPASSTTDHRAPEHRPAGQGDAAPSTAPSARRRSSRADASRRSMHVAGADQRRSRSSARGRTRAGTPRCTPPSCQHQRRPRRTKGSSRDDSPSRRTATAPSRVVEVRDLDIDFWVDGTWYPAVDRGRRSTCTPARRWPSSASPGPASRRSRWRMMGLLPKNASVRGSIQLGGLEIVGLDERAPALDPRRGSCR